VRSEVVLDASALLALLNSEPGSATVAAAFPGVSISAVNLSEVVAKLVERSMPAEAVRTILEDLDLDIHPFDAEAAHRAGALRTATRQLGLSFGDRACLALGRQLGRPVLTTDGVWGSLDLGVTVRAIR
jgi:PIN domain nuclease of toxin-antitoxin system